jgi:hypothetical protein
MADITNDKGSLEEKPSDKTNTNTSQPGDKLLDRDAEKSAKRASETIKRYDEDHDIFTK